MRDIPYRLLKSQKELKEELEGELKEDFFGPGTNVFVGRHGYPEVNVGPLSLVELEGKDLDPALTEDPSEWFGMDYERIIELRSLVMRSKKRARVRDVSDFTQENQLLAMADEPVDVELEFSGKPRYELDVSRFHQPMGPSASLEDMDVTDHVRIARVIQKLRDDEMKAEDAMVELYRGGIDVYRINSVLSSGALGERENRKLVPTRWSITAVDDTVSDDLLGDVRDQPSIHRYRVYESYFLDNKVCILLMPGNWEYEAFESWAPGSFWAKTRDGFWTIEEYEPYEGRTDYADEMGGCYYATRLAVAEQLAEEGRQARCIAFREVYEGYQVPVGVWQVRENVRNGIEEGPEEFETMEKALEYIEAQLRIPMEEYKQISKVLSQKRISEFVQ